MVFSLHLFELSYRQRFGSIAQLCLAGHEMRLVQGALLLMFMITRKFMFIYLLL